MYVKFSKVKNCYCHGGVHVLCIFPFYFTTVDLIASSSQGEMIGYKYSYTFHRNKALLLYSLH